MKKIQDYSRLIIIGNGFDLMHDLPTSFTENFKPIAQYFEQESGFWDYYGHGDDLWSNFEIALGNPDFNELFEILSNYYPDYLSDSESDRDGIITQVDLVGHLTDALNDFASAAEEALYDIRPLKKVWNFFTPNDYFVSFNYTSTLETIYDIRHSKVFYPHGKIKETELIMGYENGKFHPEPIYEVIQDRMPPKEYSNINEYLDNIEDYYVRTAYKNLYDKVFNFNKTPKIHDLVMFIEGLDVKEVVIIGHSCKIDFAYFEIINTYFKEIEWNFYYYSDEDLKYAELLCNHLGLDKSRVNLIRNNFKW